MDISSKISKVKNYRKISDSEYQLQAAWTSSDMVEMNNGNSLEKELENINTDIDNKLSALETNIDWKETVETYDDIATIYPNPEDGWTVNTKDNNITYRYNGSEWVAISANAIPKATNEVDGLMTKEYAKKLDGLTKYTPDGTTITADEDGTLHGADTIQVDGITITRDDATKVIALAKTLQDKIGTIDNKVDQNYVVNNLTTTEQGFVLDGRQGKALQDQITSLNGSLNDVATKNDINALNPSGAIRLYSDNYIGTEGAGWYRFAKITFDSYLAAKGASYICIETLIRQIFSNALGCFHKIDFYLIYSDSARISVTGYNTSELKKVRIVRNGNTIFLDVYSSATINKTEILSFIPFDDGIQSAERVENRLVPETADGEVIVRSVDLADNI